MEPTAICQEKSLSSSFRFRHSFSDSNVLIILSRSPRCDGGGGRDTDVCQNSPETFIHAMTQELSTMLRTIVTTAASTTSTANHSTLKQRNCSRPSSLRASSTCKQSFIVLLIILSCSRGGEGFGKSRFRLPRVFQEFHPDSFHTRTGNESSYDFYTNNPFHDGKRSNKPESIFRLQPKQFSPNHLFRLLWRRGMETSIMVAEGVRELRGGGGVSGMGGTTLKATKQLAWLDRCAREFAVFVAWMVSFQTIGTAAHLYRQSLAEVCSAYVCISPWG